MDKSFFLIKNPWRAGHPTSPPGLARTALAEVLAAIDRNEVGVVYGPRRAGKTTLLLAAIDQLIRVRGVPPRAV